MAEEQHEYIQIYGPLLEQVLRLTNEQNRIVSTFQITSTPGVKQFLTGYEVQKPENKEEGKEILCADDFVQLIIEMGIMQEVSEGPLNKQQQQVNKYFDEMVVAINQMLAQRKAAICDIVNDRLISHYFLKRYKNNEYKDQAKLYRALQKVIDSLDHRRIKEKAQQKSDFDQDNERRMHESLHRIDRLKAEIKNIVDELLREKLESLGIIGKCIKAAKSFKEKTQLQEYNKKQESQSMEGLKYKELDGILAKLNEIAMPGYICSKGKGLTYFGEDRFATMSFDGTVVTFVDDGSATPKVQSTKKFEVGSPDLDCSVSSSPSGQYLLVSGFSNKSLYLCEWENLLVAQQWTATSDSELTFSTFLGSDKKIAAGYLNGDFKVFEAKKPSVVYFAHPWVEGVRSMAAGASPNDIFLGFGDGNVSFWDMGTSKAIWQKASHTQAVYSLAVLHEKPLVASGSWDKTVVVMNWKTGETLSQLSECTGAIMHIEFSFKGESMLVTSCSEQVYYVSSDPLRKPGSWSVSSIRKKSKEETGNIHGAAVQWERGRVFVANHDSSIYTFKIK